MVIFIYADEWNVFLGLQPAPGYMLRSVSKQASDFAENLTRPTLAQIRAVPCIQSRTVTRMALIWVVVMCPLAGRFSSNVYPTSRTITDAALCFLKTTLSLSSDWTTVASHGECDRWGGPTARWRAEHEDWGVKAAAWDERPRVTDTWDYVDGRERREYGPPRRQGDPEDEPVQCCSRCPSVSTFLTV
jgi:hypothetical protein